MSVVSFTDPTITTKEKQACSSKESILLREIFQRQIEAQVSIQMPLIDFHSALFDYAQNIKRWFIVPMSSSCGLWGRNGWLTAISKRKREKNYLFFRKRFWEELKTQTCLVAPVAAHMRVCSIWLMSCDTCLKLWSTCCAEGSITTWITACIWVVTQQGVSYINNRCCFSWFTPMTWTSTLKPKNFKLYNQLYCLLKLKTTAVVSMPYYFGRYGNKAVRTLTKVEFHNLITADHSGH